ncbi:dihydrofolate reductase family protein [Pararhodonellum marinum]|uniref:dihydrofolate reductase family protein n=1 Tax=Pararhodonellum marinum TaxID=2755358 RepID=UPI00188F392A|nr:dihydrofolate reductase family protein [Pararhodonellum marinum]
MRKLKLQMQMTLDGFVAGPNGEMDWVTMPWTADIDDFVSEIMKEVDTILLGRKLAEGFIPYWAGVASDPKNPERTSGQMFTDTQKLVFSKSLSHSDPKVKSWPNTTLVKEDLMKEIQMLKKQAGKDIFAYGGAQFVSNLIKHNLVDEFFLFYNPVALSTGLSIFGALSKPGPLHLVSSKSFECGIVVHHYFSKSSETNLNL